MLERFDVTLEEAQHLVMTARLQLGWVTEEDLYPAEEAEGEETVEEAPAEA